MMLLMLLLLVLLMLLLLLLMMLLMLLLPLVLLMMLLLLLLLMLCCFHYHLAYCRVKLDITCTSTKHMAAGMDCLHLEMLNNAKETSLHKTPTVNQVKRVIREPE